MNPVEHLWDDLREKSFHNRVFDSIGALEVHLEIALRDMEIDRQRVHSIVAWPWIILKTAVESYVLDFSKNSQLLRIWGKSPETRTRSGFPAIFGFQLPNLG